MMGAKVKRHRAKLQTILPLALSSYVGDQTETQVSYLRWTTDVDITPPPGSPAPTMAAANSFGFDFLRAEHNLGHGGFDVVRGLAGRDEAPVA